MSTTDSYGQRVGGIVGSWDLFELEKHFYHGFDLLFIGSAVACYCLLDLKGGKFRAMDALFC